MSAQDKNKDVIREQLAELTDRLSSLDGTYKETYSSDPNNHMYDVLGTFDLIVVIDEYSRIYKKLTPPKLPNFRRSELYALVAIEKPCSDTLFKYVECKAKLHTLGKENSYRKSVLTLSRV